MSTINLTCSMEYAVTTIPNIFLDKYMPAANGEFVKVYLYILRALTDNAPLSICGIADKLNHTEKDVMRALKYWEQTGLLRLEFSESETITAIQLLNPESDNSTTNIPSPVKDPFTAAATVESAASAEIPVEVHVKSRDRQTITSTSVASSTVAKSYTIPEKKVYSPAELEHFTEQDDISMLMFIAEKYTGKSLSGMDTNTLLYIYDKLHFSTDLIEYLLEYCVSAGHKSMRYIEKVALGWAEEKITTVEEAKQNTSLYSKSCYPVLKAFGLNGRNPGESEKAFIVKWTNSYGFSMDIILDACNRTIQAIHQPSFEYADTILTHWNKSGVHKLDDIKKLDDEFAHKKSSKAAAKPTPVQVKNTFNDFSQRTYDYDELEKRILANR